MRGGGRLRLLGQPVAALSTAGHQGQEARRDLMAPSMEILAEVVVGAFL